MTYGIDTDFLVAVEIKEHPFHANADALLESLLSAGHDLALAPQTLAEFIHIVTDSKRMPLPLSMSEAIRRAEYWWQATEVVRVFPNNQTVADFTGWLAHYQLGRKRLLDTLLAATFRQAAITKLLTNNQKDYSIFGCFEIISFCD